MAQRSVGSHETVHTQAKQWSSSSLAAPKNLSVQRPPGTCTLGHISGPYWAVALTIAPAENIFVLSAKYGLVRLQDRLKPYDLKMGAGGGVDIRTVRRQAKRLGITTQKVIALGGSRYVGLIRELWPSAEAPLGGKGGLFQQIAYSGFHLNE
jgi:hypothetical protein